jgi:hypothetical protein
MESVNDDRNQQSREILISKNRLRAQLPDICVTYIESVSVILCLGNISAVRVGAANTDSGVRTATQ